MNQSYWERTSFFKDADYVIIGAGIVGLFAALEIKNKKPSANVLVLERSFLPDGASTKNAGFACFGSLSELIVQLQKSSETELLHLVKKRWEGLKKLRQALGDDVIDFIISISNKSIRVIINYLEKFKLLNQAITVDIATSLCTNISFKEFNKYTELCKVECNLREAIKIMYNLINRGYSVMDILDNYFIYIKTSTIVTEEEKYEIIPYICKYISIFNNIHEDEIELYHFTNNLIHMFTPKV